MKKLLISLFLVFFLLFYVHFRIVGQAIYGDGIYYWSYAHALYFNHDLNLYNGLEHIYSPQNNNTLKPTNNSHLKIDKISWYQYPPGSSITWVFGFIFADFLTKFFTIFNKSLSFSGYSDLYQFIVGIENILFIIAGIYFLIKTLQMYVNSTISYITSISLLLGTNLLYYGSIDVLNSHPLSFLTSSFLLWYFIKSHKKQTYVKWFILGFTVGILALIRTQDLLFLILPFVDIARLITIKKMKIIEFFISILLLIFGTVVSFIPELIIWKNITGSFFKSPYALDNQFHFNNPHVIGLAFNSQTGFVLYTPLLILAFIGLFFFIKKQTYLGTLFSIFILLQMYLIANWSGWQQGSSFGIRMFISTYPLYAIGLSQIITLLIKKYSVKICIALMCMFVLYNIGAIFYFLLFVKGITNVGSYVSQGTFIRNYIREKL